LAYKIQTPGNYPEETIQRSEHGESLKSRILSEAYMLKKHGELVNNKHDILKRWSHHFHELFKIKRILIIVKTES